jgi:hypothetical protein
MIPAPAISPPWIGSTLHFSRGVTMTDILKAIALTCAVLLLVSAMYLLVLLWLSHVAGANPGLLRNSAACVQADNNYVGNVSTVAGRNS